MRYIFPMLALLAASIAGWQAAVIAGAGVTYHIPQLEGDGGGALLAAITCFAGGVSWFLKRWVSVAMFTLAALVSALVAVVYYDDVLWLWAGIALTLSTIGVVLTRRSGSVSSRHNHRRTKTAT